MCTVDCWLHDTLDKETREVTGPMMSIYQQMTAISTVSGKAWSMVHLEILKTIRIKS